MPYIGNFPTGLFTPNAVDSEAIAPGAVNSSDIADSAVTSDKINSSAVTTAKINDSAVTTAKIASGNVTTTLIADSAVTTAKININSDLAFNGANVSNVGLGSTVATSTSNVLTLNFGNSQVFTCTLTEDTTITPSNIPAGGGLMLLKLTNGGNYTVSYSGNAMFAADTAPTLTSSGVDYLLFVCTTADSYAVTPSITNVI